jgi:hypothetical protein
MLGRLFQPDGKIPDSYVATFDGVATKDKATSSTSHPMTGPMAARAGADIPVCLVLWGTDAQVSQFLSSQLHEDVQAR